MKGVVMRVARVCRDVDALADQYGRGLGFEILAHWHDHEGFDGVVLGHPHAQYHLEFVRVHNESAPPAPHKEHLLVFYLPEREEWIARCRAVEAADFGRVRNDNPYWERVGRTYIDRAGGPVVLQNAAWSA